MLRMEGRSRWGPTNLMVRMTQSPQPNNKILRAKPFRMNVFRGVQVL